MTRTFKKALSAVNKTARVAIEKGLNVSVHAVDGYVNVHFYLTTEPSETFFYIDNPELYYGGREGMLMNLDKFVNDLAKYIENYGKTENIAEGA